MLIGRISGATRYLGAPAGWDPATQGECGALAIRDVEYQPGENVMVSAWLPTPDEVARIQAGQPVYLWIFGTGHPPVSLSVPEQQ